MALAAVMACTAGLICPACGNKGPTWNPPENTETYDIPQDYCRTYYEVFVRSFADGNGDGIGDLRGLANNLDYLNDGNDKTMTDLGINGIWMMPINQSPSYHKYDVMDYYDIDDEYGTLADFDYLVQECNKRGIWLQMDLVLNHTSTEHEWFKKATAAAKAGKSTMTDADLSRYVIKRSATNPESQYKGQWYKIGGTDYWYLGNFSSQMPDLNLNNGSVREEITKIVDFWLERGIRSFRLDAVPWACENEVIYSPANENFWTWFNNYCNQKGEEVFGKNNDGINAYCYNVGEVWSGSDVVDSFFKTGMSNFNYSMGGGDNVGFAAAVNGRWKTSSVVEDLERRQSAALANDTDALLSNFLSNHDNNRSAGFMKRDPTLIKKAAGFYLLSPGNPYIYYGEEIGALGSGVDENKRMAFNWGDSRTVKNPLGANYEDSQALGDAYTQSHTENSILTYYRNAIRLRNRFPEIGRGVIVPYAVNSAGTLELISAIRSNLEQNAPLTSVNDLNQDVGAYTLEWNSRKVLIIHNLGEKEAVIGMGVTFAGYKVVGELKAAGGNITLDNGSLKLAPGTSVVLCAYKTN